MEVCAKKGRVKHEKETWTMKTIDAFLIVGRFLFPITVYDMDF